ncbi:MAG: CoA pyrophosphatase [bacterium]|nr:CoA pyrophosphatase [bacterium]
MSERPVGTASSWIIEIRKRLAEPPPKRMVMGDRRPAAVLVPLFVNAGQLWVVLTKRSDDLPQHGGQVAFPGGGYELGEDAWTAALRETREEIGLKEKGVARLGELDDLDTFSGFRIRPCVGAIPYPYEIRINEAEIADVFEVPVMAFADVRVVEDRVVTVDGHDRMFRIYHVGRHRVWGLTAAIVRNLTERLGLEMTAPA